MAEQIRANRPLFLATQRSARHITEMDQWVTNNPRASMQQTVDQFEAIIRRALASGAMVSDHLSDNARDISLPIGTPQEQNAVEARIQALGARVLREPHAAGGPHWHVDW
ncbi:MAG: hypothetical protein LAP87_16860 [Acidobacteriia bacterium]|nr:hypothetical protein [Terriglobia bacterium]